MLNIETIDSEVLDQSYYRSKIIQDLNIKEGFQMEWPSNPNQDLMDLLIKTPIYNIKRVGGLIAFDKKDETPPKIDQKYVHKNHIENVIISVPQNVGHVWYFNMFKETNEINFDHPSDHIQGVLMMEAVRQASIATTHLNGSPFDSVITLKKFNIDFIDFLHEKEPVIIRAISRPVVFRKGKFFQYVMLNIIQSGKVCATAIVQGMAFENSITMEKYLSLITKV